MAVDSVAVQYAVPFVVFCAPLVCTHVAEPRLVLPFVKETEPDGPAPLLLVCTCAVNTTLAPEVIEDKLLVTATPVGVALLIVTESVLLELLEL
jgi:hypothetical protein